MKQFVENSSIHGIKYVFEENNLIISKILWALALVGSFCGFSFYIYAAYVKWQLDPEIVKRTRELNSTEFPAPAITFCSPLFAKNNSANFLKTYLNYRKKIPSKFSQEECHRLAANLHWCNPSASPMVDSICGEFDLGNINVVDLIAESSLTVDEQFLLCNETECENWIFRYFTDFGMCFTNNMMSASMIFNTDVIHEDFMEIITKFNNESEPLWTPEIGYKNNQVTYPERAEKDVSVKFYPTLKEVDKMNECEKKIFRIFIHKPHEIVTPYHDYINLAYEEFIDYRIETHAHRTDPALKDFSADLRKCYFEDERKLKFFKTYTKALCQWECRANLTLKTCGCVKFSMPRDKSTKVCNLTSLEQCVVDVPEMSCDCYEACVDVSYTYKMNRTPFNRNFFDSLEETSSMSWADFTIASETVEEIENFLSYKVQNFISDFGGLLGLFMGCSLLSIIEIFYYIFHGFFGLFSSNKITDKIKNEEEITLADVMNKLTRLNDKINQNDEKFKMEIKLEISTLRNDFEKFRRNTCVLFDLEEIK